MARIVLTAENVVLREAVLAKERITLGRAPHNDIVIDDCAVSAEHMAIVTVNDDSFLEDLNSTNGTQVNGQPVKKHFLQDGDVMQLAGYRITYIASPISSTLERGLLDECMDFPRSADSAAVIHILTGPNAGKEAVLKKPLTTIGRPGLQIAGIIKCRQGYCLTHITGHAYPLLNGKPAGMGVSFITNGDVIDVGSTRMQFLMGKKATE